MRRNNVLSVERFLTKYNIKVFIWKNKELSMVDSILVCCKLPVEVDATAAFHLFTSHSNSGYSRKIWLIVNRVNQVKPSDQPP